MAKVFIYDEFSPEDNAMLQALYSSNFIKKHLHYISENCFRVNAFRVDFLGNYKDMTQYEMYEGLVLKRADGKLEDGYSENNNIKTQIKCRKGTKNYIF